MADGASRLFVQNLPPHCDERALRKHFAAYGVTDVSIPRHKTDKKKGRGIAFVGLASAAAAQQAANFLDGAYWRTSKLRVSAAEKRRDEKRKSARPAPPAKRAKVTAAPEKPRLRQTRRERFMELSGVSVAAAPIAEEAVPEPSAEAFDAGLDDLAYLRSKQDAVQEEAAESDGEDDANARVFLANLPFDAPEEAIETLCEPYGAVSEVHLPIDKTTRQRKGFGFATFVLPSDADACVEGLHGSSFQGRVVTAARADARPADHAPLKAKHTFSEKRDAERKLKAASEAPSKSREFVSASAAQDAAATEAGVAKTSLFDPLATDAAVASTLAESSAQNEARGFFATRGYALEARTRSRTALLVKNLSTTTSTDDLRTLFGANGVVTDVILAPAKTTAIIEFEQPSEARAALKRLAYKPYDGTPLYVGWAPLIQEDSDDELVTSTVFVKNLSFRTTVRALEKHFAGCGTVRSVVFPATPDAGFANRGYGFVEFARASEASNALRNKAPLEGRVLVLALSEVSKTKASARKKQTKVVVRNLAFAASDRDVRDLFGTFGPLRTVRVPKRYDGRARGFAFVEFERAADALNARRALGAAHLYGRHLVIDWADGEDERAGVK